MSKRILRATSLVILLALLLPVRHPAHAAPPLPPVDMFQLPWELGKAWVALDGFDNGSDRHLGSPHHYLNGGALDFAPHNNMRKGEDTSSFWVTAAAAGTVVETSACHLKIAHANAWISEYYHLANFQVRLGDAVERNQRLAVIANAASQPVCLGSVETDIPHLHFALRPNMVGATFAGWEFKYNSFFNRTTFVKGGNSLGLFQPLLNEFGTSPGSTPTPTGAVTGVPGTPSSTPTPPTGPYVSTTVGSSGIQIGETTLVTVRLNNVPPAGYTSAEFTCTYNPTLIEVSNITTAGLFGADPAAVISGPHNGSFILAIAGSQGNKATTSGIVFTFHARGLQAGQSAIGCPARVSQGNNTLTGIPSIGTSLTILGLSPTSTPSPPQVTTPTPTAFASDWLTFTNIAYGFEFKYPPQGVIAGGRTDIFARLNLPFTSGTNLSEKYLEVAVVENATSCRSPVAASSSVHSSETVIINGISFLKETGGDPAAGSLYQFVAYSTQRETVCVSLSFILHSSNPGNFSTPPPVFDYAAESAVFSQIASTYLWLASPPTPTPTLTATAIGLPTSTSTPIGAATSTFTPFPASSPTITPPPSTSGLLTGRVTASKPVTVIFFDGSNAPVASVTANPDGTFSLTAPAGTYTVRATASGFLSAQGSAVLTGGSTTTKPEITLSAGDINGDNVIDQFDAMTIGMSYNTTAPLSADLNNDGIINVLDLELLAGNYRKTGPVVWQ